MADSNERLFDPATYAHLSGTTVVEAGAGTGKTYSIADLYLRLLLEGDNALAVGQVLVVTFTIAATAELRNRLRRRLTEAQKCLEMLPGAEALRVVEELRKKGLEDAAMLRRCRDALADFDKAPIYTIHGFCQRMLQENAFESGVRYGIELRTDVGDLLEEFYYDFFRQNNYCRSPLRTRLWMLEDLTIVTLRKETKTLLGAEKDGAIVWNDSATATVREEDLARDETAIVREIAALKSAFDNAKIAEEFKKSSAKLSWAALARLPEVADVPLDESPATDDDLTSRVKRLGTLLRNYRQEVLSLARQQVGMRLHTAKENGNFMTFDDLLNHLRERLRDEETAARLREVIREKFRYAIVDEFQDTDDIQNEIFQRLFDGDSPESGRGFFMIGDPKQAIYGFRGGDVHTYLEATQKVADPQRKPRLTTNYRSSVEYIGALNQLRETRGEREFFNLDGKIDFPEIGVPENIAQQRHLLFDGAPVTESARLFSRCECKNAADRLAALRAEIEALVGNPRVQLDNGKGALRPVGYGDIAILSMTNPVANDAAAALRKDGIPCVLRRSMSVYTTPEAADLLFLLDTLADPSQQTRINRLLTKRFFPFSAAEIVQLCENGNDFPQKLLELRRLWRENSFLEMSGKFLRSTMRELFGAALPAPERYADMTVAQAIVAKSELPRDTRSLAVFQQLQEKLAKAAMNDRLGNNGLMEFLRKKIQENPSEVPEEDRLRLLTQNDSVSIMTIHASKGLEFPIVFVMGLMTSDVMARQGEKFHEMSSDGHVRARFNMTEAGSENSRKANADEESRQERLRLFYVAATRASFLCRFLDGRKATTTKVSFLEALSEVQTPGEPPKKVDPVPLLPDEEWCGIFAKSAAPPETLSSAEVVAVDCESFDRKETPLPAGWQTCSYTSIARGATEGDGNAPAEVPGMHDDEIDPPEAPPAAADEGTGEETGARAILPDLSAEIAPIFRFPRGERAGTCWHALLEKIDFTKPLSELAECCERHLESYSQLSLRNADESARECEKRARMAAFMEMMAGLLETRLPNPANPAAQLDFSLSAIPFSRRRSELHFEYVLRRGFSSRELLSAGSFPEIVWPASWQREYKAVSEWVVNGSIDLLFQGPDGKFYIVDWKTNSRNCRFEDFRHAGLVEEMNSHLYTLQYLLYTTAFLHGYAQMNPGWTLTESSYRELFGGVLYCFVRGIRKSPETTNGFYATLPPFGLVRKFYEHLSPQRDTAREL